MNKLLIIIIFSISCSFSQNKEPLKDKESALKYLAHVLCNHGLSINPDSDDFFSLKIHKNIFNYNSKNTSITSNGKTILSANKNFKELEIYSLTQKEKKECFLSKFLKEFEIQNILGPDDIIKENGSLSSKFLKKNNIHWILGEVKKLDLKVKVVIGSIKTSLDEDEPNGIMKILGLIINDNPFSIKDYEGDTEFFMVQNYGEKSWSEKDNNINIAYLDSIQHELIDFYKKEKWEIIDFR